MNTNARRSISYVNRTVLTIHTLEGLDLCQGKPIPNSNRMLPDVYTTGTILNMLWHHTKKDDPYAEYGLIHVEERLKSASNKLDLYQRVIKRNRKQWKAPDGLNIQSCEAVEPLLIKFDEKVFNTPHAKLLLVLVARFDDFMRELMSYRQLSIISNRRFHTLKRRALRSVRAAMQESKNHKISRVTRDDIREKKQNALDAINELGMLPLDILTRKVRSQFGPLH